MNTQIKQELHHLIDKCDNEGLLEDAKTLLQEVEKGKDWWNDLSAEDKNLVMESEASYEKGDFISHEALINGLCPKNGL